jgi:hypothetical protein
MRTIITTVALALALGSSSAAFAQSEPTVTNTVSSANAKGPTVWGILPWNGIGVGGRFMIPLGLPSLLNNPQVHDSFALEVGADFLHWSYDWAGAGSYSWSEILVVAGGMWNLWFNEKLAAYPKIDFGYAKGWFSGWENTFGGVQPSYGGFFWDFALGGMYKLNNNITLRAEVGYRGLKLGAGWLF